MVICSPGKSHRAHGLRQINPSGKSLLIFGSIVKPPNQKYFAFHFWKSELQLRRLIPEEGRWPSSPSVGMGCGGRGQRQAFFAPDETLFAYGEVVWSWRRDAGAKLAELSADDGDNKPAHRGEHDISRKAIAQGMSECFRSPVCSCAPNAQFFGTRDGGCSVHPAFPAPSISNEGQRTSKNSGKSCRENVDACLAVMVREGG